MSGQKYEYQTPVSRNDGWKTGSLLSQRIDTSYFNRFFDTLATSETHGLHSFLVIKNDTLVLEKYFDSQQLTSSHDLRSTTKSITSLLVGIALDKGFISSIDDPVALYLKPYWPSAHKDSLKNTVTIRHLLTMSSGLDCNDADPGSPGNEDRMYETQDWISFMANLPAKRIPGDTSLYCTGGVILLGEIISQASGMRVDRFAERYLFKPLAIENARWNYFKNDEKVDTGGHLSLTPRDLCKIGQLILHRGKWGNHQVVSEKWINTATSERIRLEGKFAYGYLWWRHSFKVKEKNLDVVFARGNGGQFLFIFPALKLVAVFTGGNYNSPRAELPFKILDNVVLPSQPELK